MRASEIREMTREEMRTKLEDLQETLRDLRFGHVMQQVSNPLQIRAVRRDIARLRTIIAEVEAGAAAEAGGGTMTVGGDEA